MFIKIMLNYIFGYVNILIEGYYIERFINICRNKKNSHMEFKKKRRNKFIS